MWNTLGHAATVAQLVGADVGGLISMIIQAAVTAQQNKKECEQLARRVFTIGELLQHLQDPEVLRRPELRRPLSGLGDTLREAHELVMACQDRSAVYRLVLAGRQAERFRDVQSKIDSYLFVFPIISHLDITRRLDRIYNILVPNDTAGPSTSAPQIAVQVSHQYAPRIDWNKEPYEVQEFTFKELAKATNNFDPHKKIGEGGFSKVYMGSLPDGREVVIKRCVTSSLEWGMEYYRTEVTVLRSVSHKHIVRLFGYCALLQQEKRQLLPKFRKKENEVLIVYEYLENRSLDRLLLGLCPSPVTASWKMRIEIVLGVSRAIEYLQSYAERPVIHHDIKLSNILLDASWMPRLADFGLALTWQGPDHTEVRTCGTLGYMALEYAISGSLNLKTDVYSFGVVMLEILTGKTVHSANENLVENKREACEEEEREACEAEEHKRQCEEEEREACEGEEHKRHESKEGEKDKRIEESDEDNFARAPRYYGLVDFAVALIEAGELWKVLDMRPAAKPTPRQLEALELVAQAAVRCVRLQPEDRPSISEVVTTLEEALELARCDG